MEIYICYSNCQYCIHNLYIMMIVLDIYIFMVTPLKTIMHKHFFFLNVGIFFFLYLFTMNRLFFIKVL